MKLAIMSDLHIGKRQYRTDENGYNKFEHIGYRALQDNIDIILREKPDLIINAGDVFDTANPSILAMKHYYNMQEQLKDIPTMTILGNHDFAFINRNTKCSAVEMAHNTYFADYSLKTVELNDILFIMMPYIYDKADKIKSMFYDCNELAKKSTAKKKILVTHGVTEHYYKDSLIGDAFMLPDALVRQFDLVIIGHIHTPFDYKEGKTLVLSPGAMIDYQAYEDRTGPIFLDTNTMEFRKELVKTPHIIKLQCDETNINEILSNLTEDIYHISYKGDTHKIDNDLFISGRNKAANVVIDVVEDKITEENKSHTMNINFMEWIKENHSEYLDIFKKAKEDMMVG